MSETGPGFQVGDKVYPYVPPADWTNEDFLIARKVSGLTPTELFSPDADEVLLGSAFVAVAIRHQFPDQRVDQLVDLVLGLKLGDVEEVGFSANGDASPPDEAEDEANQKSSSASSGKRSGAIPESESPKPSGRRGSDTGSPE